MALRILVSAGAFLVFLSLSPRAQQAIRASVDSEGVQANDFSSYADLSATGRYVAFQSGATNLVAGDTNERKDVFVRDLRNGITVRASVASGGVQAEEESWDPSISGSGRFVAFSSFAANLSAADTNAEEDVFVHDLRTGLTRRVSVDPLGLPGNGRSWLPRISTDGSCVVFWSFASNLVALDTNQTADLFVRDLLSGFTVRATVDSSGAQVSGQQYPAYPPAISADGRFVAFSSHAVDLVSTGGMWEQVYVRDLELGLTWRASVDATGVPGNQACERPSISWNGRWVAFQSRASNLAAGDGSDIDVFVHDSWTGATTMESTGEGSGLSGGQPALSADGRTLAFVKGTAMDVYLRDRITGQVTLMSAAPDGGPAGGSWLGSLSANGRAVGFISYAPDLVPGDTNRQQDVFVARRP